MSLQGFLESKADELAPLKPDWPDCRAYSEDVNDDALSDAWLENQTSYIWKVGTLAQWDSNKCDYIHVFIGHERALGRYEFIGMLYYSSGENDDPGRCLRRYPECLAQLHPVFDK